MRRAARYGAYAIGAIAVLLVAAAIVIPEILDRPAMAARLQARISAAVGGEVRWQEFSVRILPFPRAMLRGLEVKTAAATITTDEASAALRLWPLFLGRAEIASAKVARPVVHLTIVPAAAVPQEARVQPAPRSALEAYKSTMETLVRTLQNFAPDTDLEVDRADISIRVEGVPPIEATNLTVTAHTNSHGVELEASAASRYWNSMKLAGKIEYADLSSSAELHLVRVNGQAWLDWLLRSSGVSVAIPDVDLSTRFRGDARKVLELDIDGKVPSLTLTRGAKRVEVAPVAIQAKLVADANEVALHLANLGAGAITLSNGVARYTPKDDGLAGDLAYDLDLPQALGYAREFVPGPLARIESLTGALHGRVQVALHGADWRIRATVDKSDATLKVKDVPTTARLTSAAVEADNKTVRAERVAVSLPLGELALSNTRYSLKDGAAAATLDFDLGVAPALELARAMLPKEKLDVVESGDGRVRGKAQGTLMGKNWTAALELTQSDARAKVKGLPGPVTITGAKVRATPKTINVEGAMAKLLDSTVTASATISDYTGNLRVEASVADAAFGAKTLAWAAQLGKLPSRLEPKTPIHLAVQRFTWAPKSPLQVQAEMRFDGGPVIGADVAWSPETLAVRRASIKDRVSDLTVSVKKTGSLIEGTYSGTLDSRSIAAMLKNGEAPAGAIEGDLRFTFDSADRRRTSVAGTLKGEKVDLSSLAGAPAAIERIDIAADGNVLRIGEASLTWAEQHVALRGEVKHGPNGPVIDATLESPGVVVDALLPKKPAAAPAKPAAKEERTPNIWPLPVTGKISVRSKFVQYEHFKVQPLSANIILADDRAVLDVQEALLCGFAVPLTVEATPKGFSASAQVAAQQQKLEEAAQCLAGENVALTGTMDLRVDVRTQGKPSELLQNLSGTVNADVRKGMVMKFALIGNILSLQNVVAVVGGGSKLGARAGGFPFRQLAAKGRFDKGRFLLDEGVFYSDAVGLGANGWISITDYQSRLTVLVAPLALLNEGVRKLPILGYVVGGTLTSLPVSVTGDIRDPLVVPLGPGAITNELTGIVSRTLSLPGKAVGK